MVFRDSPEKMGLPFKSNLHDALVVREYRLVAVTEVEAPDFDVLVRRARYDQLRVVGNVEGQDGQLEHISRLSQLAFTVVPCVRRVTRRI